MSDDSGGSQGEATDGPTEDLAARSFLVRALLERNGADTDLGWHGFVTDVATGQREVWHRTAEIVRIIDRRLSSEWAGTVAMAAVDTMTAPALTDVINDMLAILAARLPPHAAALPRPNVTLERVGERLVGLGNHRGSDRESPLGPQTLRGGRLDARVRFQLWGTSAPIVDAAVLALHSDLFTDRDQLRLVGFLKLSIAATTLAEFIDTVGGWRKATSFDVLYEYQYSDTDDADSLIARIVVTTDPEQAGSPARETDIVADDMVRWDNETAATLVVAGPATVHRISALAYLPGPALGGTVTLQRVVARATAPPTPLPDLAAFLTAVGGERPAQTNAEVTVSPEDLLTGLGPASGQLDLGDWDTDSSPDRYSGFDRVLAAPVRLPTGADRFIISYLPAPGVGPGLDGIAVVYLRINPP
ncbi:MAG: hypothetical protein ACRDST_13915 [Pseudonocardiaceae bacterium]